MLLRLLSISLQLHILVHVDRSASGKSLPRRRLGGGQRAVVLLLSHTPVLLEKGIQLPLLVTALPLFCRVIEDNSECRVLQHVVLRILVLLLPLLPLPLLLLLLPSLLLQQPPAAAPVLLHTPRRPPIATVHRAKLVEVRAIAATRVSAPAPAASAVAARKALQRHDAASLRDAAAVAAKRSP